MAWHLSAEAPVLSPLTLPIPIWIRNVLLGVCVSRRISGRHGKECSSSLGKTHKILRNYKKNNLIMQERNAESGRKEGRLNSTAAEI